jgi:hypothetical protein
MFSFQVTRNVANISKLDNELRLLNPKYLCLSAKGDDILLSFSASLSQAEVDAISGHINNFVEYSVVDEFKFFLDTKIDVFIRAWVTKIRAENLEMGITIGNGMYEFLSVTETCLDVRGTGRKVSLLGSLQTGTLSVAIQILTYMRANPSTYQAASPFFNDERLAEWIGEFTEFLTSARN